MTNESDNWTWLDAIVQFKKWLFNGGPFWPTSYVVRGFRWAVVAGLVQAVLEVSLLYGVLKIDRPGVAIAIASFIPFVAGFFDIGLAWPFLMLVCMSLGSAPLVAAFEHSLPQRAVGLFFSPLLTFVLSAPLIFAAVCVGAFVHGVFAYTSSKIRGQAVAPRYQHMPLIVRLIIAATLGAATMFKVQRFCPEIGVESHWFLNSGEGVFRTISTLFVLMFLLTVLGIGRGWMGLAAVTFGTFAGMVYYLCFTIEPGNMWPIVIAMGACIAAIGLAMGTATALGVRYLFAKLQR